MSRVLGIPKDIRNDVEVFSGGTLLEVEIRKNGATANNEFRNCHKNVQEWVDKIGGERVSGWLLDDRKKWLKKGCYLWSFHSVWNTPEGKLVDVTKNVRDKKKFIIFATDVNRVADGWKGTSYNSINVFQNRRAIRFYKKHYDDPYLQSPGIYWSSGTVPLRPVEGNGLDEGKYYLFRDFNNNLIDKNIELLKKTYGVEVRRVSDGLKLEGHQRLPVNQVLQMYFDFAIN